MPKQLPPLLKTKDKAISVCMAEANDEKKDEVTESFLKMIIKITRFRLENLWVLNFVLKELPRLKKGHKIGFDFGTKKEWELKRNK